MVAAMEKKVDEKIQAIQTGESDDTKARAYIMSLFSNDKSTDGNTKSLSTKSSLNSILSRAKNPSA